jgi:hypothetical protein
MKIASLKNIFSSSFKEEIQIEPDITDFDISNHQPQAVHPPHISLPIVPLPRQTLPPIRTTITPATIRPKPALTLIIPMPSQQQHQQQQQLQHPQQNQQQHPQLHNNHQPKHQQFHQQQFLVPPPPTSVYTCSFCNVRFNEQVTSIS